ncbi:MAG: DUF7670 domain-containing protein [Patescibacteria group bacterium]
MGNKKHGFVFWAPRILSILFILFLAMFSLDIFEGNYGFWGTILGLFMHNIPSLVLLLVLIIAWKRELVGATVFFLAGLAYIVSVVSRSQFEPYVISYSFIIAGPAFVIAALFLIGWQRKRKTTI